MLNKLIEHIEKLEEASGEAIESTQKCTDPEIPETVAFHKGYNKACNDILRKFRELSQASSGH